MIIYEKVLRLFGLFCKNLKENEIFWLASLLFSALLAFFFAPLFILTLYILVLRKEELVSAWIGIVRREWVFPLMLFMVYPLSLLNGNIIPGDDLLRHMRAYSHGYDYTKIYHELDPSFPKISMWYGFDVFAGLLDRAFGFYNGIIIIVILSYIFLVGVVYLIAQKCIKSGVHDRNSYIAIAISLMLISGLFFRSTLARPEVFLTLWALSAVFLRPWLWTLIGIILAPTYWLAIIYIPMAILLSGSVKKRGLSALLVLIAFLLFWLNYAGLEWLSFFWLLRGWTNARVISPGESYSIFNALTYPGVVFCIMVYLLHVKKNIKNDLCIFLMIAWFLIPGQIRYIGIIGPLLVFLSMKHFVDLNISKIGVFFLMLLFMTLSFSTTQGSGSNIKDLQNLTFVKGSNVLTGFDINTYLIPSTNVDVMVTPAMEVGAVSLRAQNQIKELRDGRISCSEIIALNYDYVVERSLKKTYKCLVLEQVYRDWRVWHVR